MPRILTLVGSLRADSVNRRLAEAAAAHAPAGVEIELYDAIASLPFYNEDVDVPGAEPEGVVAFREALDAADALLLVIPAYNGTIPAVVKNAIDWGSRPFGASAMSGTCAAVIGTALGATGGSLAHADARRSLAIAGANVVEDVELAIPGSLTRFADVRPEDDAETAAQLAEALRVLVAAIPADAAVAVDA